MKPRAHRHIDRGCDHHAPCPSDRRKGLLWRWFVANSLISGILAVCWLILRSGSKPSRFAYPCQQAALSTATLAFAAPLFAGLVAARRRVVAGLRTPVGIAVAALGLAVTAGLWGYASWAGAYRGPKMEPLRDYRAPLYHVVECSQNPAGDHFVGVNNLIALMGREGLKFYQSATESLVAGPDGIIAANDVVIVKINYQWDERGGTNTDVLRGIIRRIVDHPDTFTGEVVVCENAQFNSTSGFNRAYNNAQIYGLSPHDVVVGFQSLGYKVSHYDWTLIRGTSTTEYNFGNYSDGYVVYDYDGQINGRLSYPKFQTDDDTYVSVRYGIWDPIGHTFDRQRLKFINAPVLKSHSATYGVTANVKHYMGTVTGQLSTNSHGAIRYGMMGALLGEIQPADLNILDCIWINANPNSGPSTSYGGATRRDELVASVDPVAADIWAAKNILIPAFLANGYSPPWPYPSADPDDPNSEFREYLDNSMNFILAAGYKATNNPDQIDTFSGSGAAGDFDGDSDVDLADFGPFEDCYTGPDGGPIGGGCDAGDFDGDDDIDCTDWSHFYYVWTEPDEPPIPADCSIAGPLLAPSPHDARKNRYLSFDPNSVESVAFQVEMTSSTYFPGSVGVLGWVGEPGMHDVSRIVSEPFFSDAWPAVVHLGDCQVVPVAAYGIRARSVGGSYSASLVVETILQPEGKWWADVVGATVGEAWTAPDGVLNFDDIQAAIQTFEGHAQAPHWTWMDIEDEVPNAVVNMTDIQLIVLAFEGAAYPFIDPALCP